MKTAVEVGALGFDRNRGQLDFWLRRTVTQQIEQQEEVTWTDTRSCAAARPLLASIREIPVPKFAPIPHPKGTIVTHGARYFLRTPSDEGKLTAETNVGTPLAAWIESALKTLEPCWGTRVPQRTR